MTRIFDFISNTVGDSWVVHRLRSILRPPVQLSAHTSPAERGLWLKAPRRGPAGRASGELLIAAALLSGVGLVDFLDMVLCRRSRLSSMLLSGGDPRS